MTINARMRLVSAYKDLVTSSIHDISEHVTILSVLRAHAADCAVVGDFCDTALILDTSCLSLMLYHLRLTICQKNTSNYIQDIS